MTKSTSFRYVNEVKATVRFIVIQTTGIRDDSAKNFTYGHNVFLFPLSFHTISAHVFVSKVHVFFLARTNLTDDNVEANCEQPGKVKCDIYQIRTANKCTLPISHL